MRILLLFFIFLFSCSPSSGFDRGFVKSEYGYLYISSDDFPVRVLVDKDLSVDKIEGIHTAITKWHVVTGLELFKLELFDFEQEFSKECGWVSVTAENIQRPPHMMPGNWNAYHRATTEKNTSRICYGFIFVDTEVPTHHYITVLIHEFGHSLGLDHDEDENSIMFKQATKNPNQYITEGDIKRIRQMYFSGR